ncbi:MAG: hypothetical protein VKI81_10505, partial [Synechococcaceae cyanobacterium]|nr:hypothetical protein [Synechococcaceae cyanobacterium]
MFVHGEDTTSILSGFTLTGGSGVWTTGFNVRSGGGVYAWEAGAKILNNKVMYNQVESDSGGGAGLVFLGGDAYWAVIDNNTISHNTSISDGFSAFGAGMSILVNAVIKNNIVEYNSCINTGGDADGGGIELELWELGSDQYAIVYNNIVRYNTLNANHYSIGGGICSFYVPCEIRNNEIYGNECVAGDRCLGGGVRILFPETKVVIAYNEIYDNSLVANYGQGGGVDVGGAAGLVILSNNDVFNNEIVGTTAAWGAGMNFVQNNEMEVIGNNVHDNSISGGSWWCGAGIYHERANGSMEISNNIIRNNIGTGTSYGGGIGLYDSEGVSYSLSSNFIQGNQSNYGGGLWTYNAFDITITNNIFVENNALSWGGAYGIRHNADDKPLNISIAYSLGEEIDFKQPKADHHPAVINNTFFANSAGDSGGAIDSDQQVYVPIFFNDIFWQNTAPSGNNIYILVSDTIYLSNLDINTADYSIYW